MGSAARWVDSQPSSSAHPPGEPSSSRATRNLPSVSWLAGSAGSSEKEEGKGECECEVR